MNNAAMILCAGLGTRLRPLTDWVAKPMVPIGDAPLVSHIAAHLRAAGIGRLVVNVHHRPGDLRAWASAAGALVSEEDDLLGTAGGLAQAGVALGRGDVLVWNGDIVSDLDVVALGRAHAARRADATLAAVARRRGEGSVGVDAGGRVVRLRGERFGDEATGADFMGVHVVGERLRSELPERGCLVGDVYIPALRAGAALAVHLAASAFLDVGSVASYARANGHWLKERALRTWVGPGATVSARTDGSVVGAGARVEADAIDCVVWPGAAVLAPVRGAVVSRHGTVTVSA